METLESILFLACNSTIRKKALFDRKARDARYVM